ncbi:hypothetical protein CBM2586_B30051 [Cupriavidus phytorum]|uniref:Uncharacterized protein n=1 Tax=Cupriavidus taiwanensis TaxID=164546 RepID=A0A375CKC0_9BURK|nr:hypothetical protein CBM2586_B30051 [Cupriavidus taiwanensis]
MSVRRHHAQRAPGADQAHVGKQREGVHGTPCDPLDGGYGGAIIEANILDGIAKLHRPFRRLPRLVGRIGQERAEPLGDQDLAPVWLDRRVQPHLRCKLLVAESGRQHEPVAAPAPVVRTCHDKAAVGPMAHGSHIHSRKHLCAQRFQTRVQGMQQLERIDMPVQRTPAAASHLRSDGGEMGLQLGMLHHPVRHARTRVPETLQQLLASAHFRLAEPYPEAARLLQIDVDPGEGQQLGRERLPMIDRIPGPARIAGKPVAFALEPYQPEISPRSAVRDVALVEQRDRRPGFRGTEGYGRTHHAAPHNDDFFLAHVCPSAARSISPAQCVLLRDGRRGCFNRC